MIHSAKTMMNKRECGYLAMLMANCLLDTEAGSGIIPGKTSDPEKRAFNKTVANRLFTFLTYYFSETDEASKMVFLNLAARYYPDDWGLLEIDEGMMTEVREALKEGFE
jgi:hypothetical protein